MSQNRDLNNKANANRQAAAQQGATSEWLRSALTEAHELDEADPLRAWRDAFWIPRHGEGEQHYFCGNSLGLQPRALASYMEEELGHWRDLAVEGHFTGPRPWMHYQQALEDSLAGLLGAKPSEVVAMNALTVNLHLLMISFFRPSGSRRRILIERQPFPSDRYAVESQLRLHGLDPDECLVEFGADSDEPLIDEAALEDYLAREGEQVAMVLWPGVQYATGQSFDLQRITRAAHAAGATIGFDLAHAVGNVPVSLHESGADFAAWCTYKYLNSGPGAVAGAFVHERHHGRDDLPRLHGWWGCDPQSRFLMEPEFVPAPGVDAWLMSNSPIFSTAPLRVSLDIFERAGFEALRKKSQFMTGWLEQQIRHHLGEVLDIITPSDPAQRGCQLSLALRDGRDAGRDLFESLIGAGIIGDWREPNIIRVAPVPLYNRFEDCHAFLRHVSEWHARR